MALGDKICEQPICVLDLRVVAEMPNVRRSDDSFAQYSDKRFLAGVMVEPAPAERKMLAEKQLFWTDELSKQVFII